MTVAIILLVVGAIQTVWMIWAIRADAAATHLSLIEAAVLKAGGAEPLPKSKLALAFDRLLLWVGLVLGLFFLAVGLFLIFAE